MASGGYKEEKSAKFYADITVADDGQSITIDWSKFAFESGITYAMNIPKGYIVLDNGTRVTQQVLNILSHNKSVSDANIL